MWAQAAEQALLRVLPGDLALPSHATPFRRRCAHVLLYLGLELLNLRSAKVTRAIDFTFDLTDEELRTDKDLPIADPDAMYLISIS